MTYETAVRPTSNPVQLYRSSKERTPRAKNSTPLAALSGQAVVNKSLRQLNLASLLSTRVRYLGTAAVHICQS